MAKPKLTPKQENFCLEYLKCGNASEAYRRSYSASRMSEKQVWEEASKLLKHPKVSQRLEELNSKAVSDAVMTRQEALERLSGFARIDLVDLVEFGSYEVVSADGETAIQSTWRIKDSVAQDPAKMAAISELAATKDGIKIKTHSPLQAIQQLAKMQGWESATKHELSGPGGTPIPVAPMTKEEYKKARAEMLHQDDC